MQRLLPDKLGMLYHAPLYERMLAFAKENTPEFPAEIAVSKWLQRFYGGDNTVHIIVDMNDSGELIGHAFIELQNIEGIKVLLCHQMAWQKGTAKSADIDRGMEYLDKLRDNTEAVCSLITVEKNSKVYEKKYGYKILRTVMIKVSEVEHEE